VTADGHLKSLTIQLKAVVFGKRNENNFVKFEK